MNTTTTTTERMRGLSLAFMLIISVLAGGIAFAGSGVAASAPAVDEAVEFSDGAQTDSATHTVEVTFTEPITDTSDGIDADNFELIVDDESVPIDDADVTPNSAEPTSQVEIDIGTDVHPNQDMSVKTSGLTDADGNAVTTDSTDVTVTGATLNASVDEYGGTPELTVFHGTTVAVAFDQVDTQYTLYNESDRFKFQGATGENSRVAVLDTSELAVETFKIDNENGGGADIELWELDLSTSLSTNTTETDEPFDVEVDSNAGARLTEVTVTSDDTDTTLETQQELEGDGTHTFTFDPSTLDTGTYTVNVTDVKTGVKTTAGDITITEATDADATFTQTTYNEHAGDIAEITVQVEGSDTATVEIGSEDVNFLANATVVDNDDDGEVTLYFDSAAVAGATSSDEYLGIKENDDGDDDALVETHQLIGVDTPLDSATYDLRAYADGKVTDVAALYLEEPNLEKVTLYSMSGTASPDTLTEFKDALHETDTVAHDDTLVAAVHISGIEGTPFDAPDGVSFEIEQTSNAMNTEPQTFTLDSDKLHPNADADNDTLYVIFDKDAPALDTSGDSTATWEFNATAEINESASDIYNTDQTASVEGTIEETDIEVSNLNSSDVLVTGPDTVNVTGTTNLAPGTELNVRVESADDVEVPYLYQTTVEVSEDGTYSATFNTSDNENTDFVATVSAVELSGVETEADGHISAVESAPDTTTTEEQDTTTTTTTTTEQTPTTTEQTSTQEPTTTETPSPSTTSTDTPGFGVIVALIALLGSIGVAAYRRD